MKGNHVIEGTQSNLFLIQGGRLITPDLSTCGVAGVVRELVLEVAAELGLQSRVAAVTLGELNRADALFITNAVHGGLSGRRPGKPALRTSEVPVALMEQVRNLVLGPVGRI